MNAVFLDSSGIIAYWNRRDQWHDAAVNAYHCIPRGTTLVTTSYVLAECGNAFARTDLRAPLAHLGDKLDGEGMLVFPSDADWHAAWVAFCDGRPGSPSLVDELSFAVMRRLGLHRVFTNDRHFADAGFETLF